MRTIRRGLVKETIQLIDGTGKCQGDVRVELKDGGAMVYVSGGYSPEELAVLLDYALAFELRNSRTTGDSTKLVEQEAIEVSPTRSG